jgi:predicted nucleotidyltransferase
MKLIGIVAEYNPFHNGTGSILMKAAPSLDRTARLCV